MIFKINELNLFLRKLFALNNVKILKMKNENVSPNALKLKSFKITIDVNGYDGFLSVEKGRFERILTSKSFELVSKKDCIINTGATIGPNNGITSYIFFDIEEDGLIKLRNNDSAEVIQETKTIKLKTTVIKFELDGLGCDFKLSANSNIPIKKNTEKYTFVRCQSYTLDCGITENLLNKYKKEKVFSSFTFSLDQDDFVIPFNKSFSAIKKKGILKLNIVKVNIDPAEISEGKPILLSDKTVIKEKRDVGFIKGLLTHLSWDGNSYYFLPI